MARVGCGGLGEQCVAFPCPSATLGELPTDFLLQEQNKRSALNRTGLSLPGS